MGMDPRWWSEQHLQMPFGPGEMNPNADGLPIPLGIPPAPFQPAQAEGGNPDRRIILPGADYPPADAQPIDLIGNADIASGSTTIITWNNGLDRIIIQQSYTLRIRGIGWDASDETANRFLTWSVLGFPPGTPITPYNQLPAGIGSVSHPSWVFINIGAIDYVQIQATNNASAGTSRYFARVLGWLYRQER